MNPVRHLLDRIPEYTRILSAASREAWLTPLIEAHLTPCSEMEARDILRLMSLPRDTKVSFGSQSGRARFNQSARRYGVSLPNAPGVSFGQLRAGIVLHEGAHIWDHWDQGKFGHGPTYQHSLRQALLLTAWRPCVMDDSIKEIYARHRGPFEFLLTVNKKNGEQGSKHHVGPFSAREAHAEALRMLKDFDDVDAVFVFSKSEGQFTGAFYKRGGTDPRVYRPWDELEEADGPGTTVESTNADRGVELPDEREAAALLPGGPEPLSPVDDSVDASLPEGTVPGGRPVRDVPAKQPAEPRAKRVGPPRRASRALELDGGNAEAWPKSEAAQVVRAFMEGKRLTPSEIVAAIGAQLTGLGFNFRLR
jgi:hypothetical protein